MEGLVSLPRSFPVIASTKQSISLGFKSIDEAPLQHVGSCRARPLISAAAAAQVRVAASPTRQDLRPVAVVSVVWGGRSLHLGGGREAEGSSRVSVYFAEIRRSPSRSSGCCMESIRNYGIAAEEVRSTLALYWAGPYQGIASRRGRKAQS